MKKVLLGLDIGSQTIKAVQLSREKGSNSLLAAGYIPTPIQYSAANIHSDDTVLQNSINRLVHDMKISTMDVVASLPSSRVVTRVISVPIMSESELTSSIPWEAEQFVPYPLAKVKIDYSIIDKDELSQKMRVLLAAAPIDLIDKYVQIITSAGLNPIALEPEILASTRSITSSFPTLSNIILVIIGALNTEIALVHNQMLAYTKPLPMGGNTLTQAIAQELGFETAQAEEYKKTYGLEEDKLEGKIAKILMPYFINIFEEIEKTVSYFKDQYPKEEVNTAVVSGGSAKLPGLILAITKNLGIDSQMGNPFVNLSVDPNILPVVTADASMYTTAVGLALKDID